MISSITDSENRLLKRLRFVEHTSLASTFKFIKIHKRIISLIAIIFLRDSQSLHEETFLDQKPPHKQGVHHASVK